MNNKTQKEELVETPQKSVLTHTALGVFQDDKGRWCLAKVRYNPMTKQTGEYEPIPNEEGTKESINYRYKIMSVREGILT